MSIAKRALILSLALWGTSAFAFEIETSAGLGIGTETPAPVYPTLDFIVAHEAGGFGFQWDLGFTGDGSYGGLFGTTYGTDGMTALIRRGGLTWRSGDLFASFGILPLEDEIESPYSLAISSLKNSKLNLLMRYEGEGFFFSDRWIALNYDSSNTFLAGDGTVPANTMAWPDRSVVVKCYGFRTGDIRFGFEDIAVFTDAYYGTEQRGPLFDASYFLIPAPSFFIQYARLGIEAPWTTDKGLNDNSIMSFFFEWGRGNLGAQAQFLVDDFNLNRFIDPSGDQNPDKIAWALGGSMETEYGTFRLDHAGATKYAFGPSSDGAENYLYGYTYYPGTEFDLRGGTSPVDLGTDYVGYLHGENNLAFRASWAGLPGGPLEPSGALELVVSGSKSPGNPWHELEGWKAGGQGTKWLDEKRLETRLVLWGKAEYALGDFKLFASASLGYVWNRLKLTAVPAAVPNSADNGIPIFKPSSESSPVATLTLGGSWTWRPGNRR
jgi:hypothetical protein